VSKRRRLMPIYEFIKEASKYPTLTLCCNLVLVQTKKFRTTVGTLIVYRRKTKFDFDLTLFIYGTRIQRLLNFSFFV
jgi:hypothetical protein